MGRPLRDGEVVHHVDGDPQHNHPANLWVLSSQRAHMVVHQRARMTALGLVPLFDLETQLQGMGAYVVRCWVGRAAGGGTSLDEPCEITRQ